MDYLTTGLGFYDQIQREDAMLSTALREDSRRALLRRMQSSTGLAALGGRERCSFANLQVAIN